jgi:hypothetical protein
MPQKPLTGPYSARFKIRVLSEPEAKKLAFGRMAVFNQYRIPVHTINTILPNQFDRWPSFAVPVLIEQARRIE